MLSFMNTTFLVHSTCNYFSFLHFPFSTETILEIPLHQISFYNVTFSVLIFYLLCCYFLNKWYREVLTVWVKTLTRWTFFVMLLSPKWWILRLSISFTHFRHLHHVCNAWHSKRYTQKNFHSYIYMKVFELDLILVLGQLWWRVIFPLRWLMQVC